MSKKYSTKFSDQWLDLGAHSTWTWLQKVPGDDTKARCTMCKTNFDVSNMGISAIVSHEKGKKHRGFVGSVCSSHTVHSFVLPAQPIPTTSHARPLADSTATSDISSGTTADSKPKLPDVSTVEPTTSTTAIRSNLSSFLNKDAVARAEILWALNGVMSHASLRSSSNAAELFKLMFPDSDIASRFAVHKDKLAYIVTYGLGPYFQQKLVDVVKGCPFYAISFDESLNKVAQKGQMDIIVRFWNNGNQEVSTRYLTSAFLGRATSADLLQAFTSAIGSQSLDLKKMIQVSSDGPNVNIKFARELQSQLADADPDGGELFQIGTCALHVVHGAYKTAHNEVHWQVHVFLRSLYYLFKDFPSRRAQYVETTKSAVFPLRFCAIRWVENSNVLQRAAEMLPSLKQYINAVSKKPPSSNCFKRVCTAVKEDAMLEAKMGFLQNIASELETFLTLFQSNKPLLPFLYNDLYALLRSLLDRFVRREVMQGIKDVSSLMDVDFADRQKQKTLQNIDVGFAASLVCKKAKGTDVLQFKDECRLFLQHLCTKLFAKCPLKYKLVKGVTCLNPQVMLSDTLRQSRVTTALEVFVEMKRMSATSADTVKRQYLEWCRKESVQNKLQSFSHTSDRLDHTLNELLQLENCDVSLHHFVQQVLVMFHGNAAVERSFSFNKACLVENLLEDSLISQRIVHDAVSACGDVSQVEITKPMIHAVRIAGTRRNECLKRKADEEQQTAAKMKRIRDDIKELEKKKARITQNAKEETQLVTDELKKLRDSLK